MVWQPQFGFLFSIASDKGSKCAHIISDWSRVNHVAINTNNNLDIVLLVMEQGAWGFKLYNGMNPAHTMTIRELET